MTSIRGMGSTGDGPATADPTRATSRSGRRRPRSRRFRAEPARRWPWIIRGHQRESYSGEEARRHDETATRELLTRGLDNLGMDLAALRLLPPSDPRKQALAWLIRTRSIVTGPWITNELEMGHPSNVSRAVSVFRTANQKKIKNLKRRLHVCKD